MLASAESGMSSTTLNSSYADASTGSGAVLVPAWWSWPYPSGGDLVFPFYYTNHSTDYNRSNIFQTINWLDSSKELTSLTLPKPATGKTRLHVFALSLWPVPECSGPLLEIQYARATQKWKEGSDKVQIVEVHVNNVGEDFVLKHHNVEFTIESPGLEVVSKGVLKRLRPGDQAKVTIGVKNKRGVKAGASGPIKVKSGSHGIKCADYTFDGTYGIAKFQPNYESVYSHDVPDWYEGAKFGIFIHWGVYAVPGWGNVGSREEYAEW